MNAYSLITKRTTRRAFRILCCVMWIASGSILMAQNNIMYVAPNITSAKSNEIARKIDQTIFERIPSVKQKIGYFNYTNKNEGRNLYNNKIKSAVIKYLLKLNKITIDNSFYMLTFSLVEVSESQSFNNRLYLEEEIPWQNSTFIINKNVDISTKIDEILTDLNKELEYYFQNGKFRLRVYINPDEFDPPEADFYSEFVDWLENEMNENDHENQADFIIYYDDKPYPHETPNVLFGKFGVAEDDWSNVQFIFIKDEKTKKSKFVKIYVKDFEFGEIEQADKYKKETIEKIYDLLSR